MIDVSRRSRNTGAVVAARSQDSLNLIALAAVLIAATIAPARALAASPEPYFLVATRDLHDPIFSESVILMLPITEDGLLEGLIINKPTTTQVQSLIAGAPILPKPAESVFFGGPVEVNTPSILLRAAHPPANAIHVFEDVYSVADPDLIRGYMKAPPEAGAVRLIIGRAQWTTEQLAAEIAEGSWYKAPAESDAVFSVDPDKLWEVLVQRGDLQEADLAVSPCWSESLFARQCIFSGYRVYRALTPRPWVDQLNP
jgi:putative transcriptional regulator